MTIRKILMSLSVSVLSLVAMAQTQTTLETCPRGAVSLGVSQYNRPLGLNNFKNLPDQMLQQVGACVSAKGVPTKAQAQRLLKSSLPAKAVRKSQAKNAPATRANYVASDTLFWESFEGWDKETMPWLPTVNKWSTQSNISDLTPYLTNSSCPTWTCYEGDGYYVPYAQDGSQMLVCMYGGEAYAADGTTVVAPAPKQDEWLVSPAVNGIDAEHYLSFDICYSPWQSHYFIEGNDTMFDRNRTSYNVEVLVTTNTRSVSFDADSYTKVYDLTTEVDKQIDATDMNDNEAVARLLYMEWRHVQIPLSEFAGKNVRIALRYTGSKGGSILIDAIRVSELLPVAKYDLPEGAFSWGFSENAMLFSTIKMGLVPAYVPTLWKNYSNADAKSYVWNYVDADGKESSSTDCDLLMPGQPSSNLLDLPVLTSTGDKRSDQCGSGMFKVGGNAVYAQEGLVENFYVGNYDPTKQYWTGEISTVGTQKAYAFGSGSGSFYGSLSNYRYNAVDGIGNFYEAPAAPYVFNTVMLPLGEFFHVGATLACTIYKVENGNQVTDEVIAQATVEDGIQIAGGWFLVFNFKENIVVDDAIFVLIDGFSQANVIDIAPLSQALNHDSDKSYAFVKLNTSTGGFAIVDVSNLLAGLEGSSNMCVSHCIGMNAVFPYLHSLDGNVFVASDKGETKLFEIDSYWNPADLTVTTDAQWVKAEPVVDELNQTFSIKITVDALPTDAKEGVAEVKISGTACEEVITVLQGEAVTAIGGVQAGGKSTLNGTFSLSGQRLDGTSQTPGLYLMKKNGKYVKVLK